MSKRRKKTGQSISTAVAPVTSPVLPVRASYTRRNPLVWLAKTNLGANILGGIVVLSLTLGVGYYGSVKLEEQRELEKRQVERVALTKEISPWLIELWYALAPFASADFVQESDSSLMASKAALDRFVYVPETPVLAARIAKAFGDSTRDTYLDLLTRTQEVEYAVRSGVELRGQRLTAEMRLAAKRSGHRILEWTPEEERKLS